MSGVVEGEGGGRGVGGVLGEFVVCVCCVWCVCFWLECLRELFVCGWFLFVLCGVAVV
jgi:hypothetical protein